MSTFGFILVLLCSIHLSAGLFEGLYCGTESCYDVLGVTRDAVKSEVAQAYRKLAKKWHPDMHRGEEAKKSAETMFQKIATAYEILRDEESRADYDYMLDNPDEFYYNYYKYYRRKVAPRVDVRLVIVVTITVVSAMQYYAAWSNYNVAIKYLLKDPKYRMRAVDIAKQENLLDGNKKKSKGKTKEQLKQEEEDILKKVLEEKMDIKGGYSRPKVTDVLWVQLVMLPYYVTTYAMWYVRWVYKFDLKREEYGDEEKFYLIKKHMGLSNTKWESVEDDVRDSYMHHNLWQPLAFKEWKEQQEAEMKAKLAESNRYKMYRRYMKNNKSQIVFGPE